MYRIDANKMRSYKAAGHTHKEVADYFGCSVLYSQKICKGIAPQQSHPEVYRNQYTNGLFDREANAVHLINEKVPQFEYVGGFTNCDASVKLKCKTCGTIVTRSLIGIRHNNGVKCPECARLASEEAKAQKEKARQEQQAEKKRQRLLKIKPKQFTFTTCVECGEVFIPTHKSRLCCSDGCSKKRQNRKKDKRINKYNTIDKDITLAKLYYRDNGRCYICGCVCNWDDKTIDGNGNTTVGESYPTIEHVNPLSNGGMHSWDNVKLACHSCNSKKSFTPPSRFFSA